MFLPSFKRAAAALALAVLVALSATAQTALPPGVQRGASVEGITEYRLPNGLRVLLFPDPSKQTITVNVTYLVGSKHENYGETGMAHLLEHLLFKGSKKFPAITKDMEARGANYNGSTWYDRTNYYESLTASDENLKWALELEADRMVNADVAKKDLDSEMTVVRNEFEMGENSPPSVLVERIFSTAYLWHNYGKSTIGARADIENVPIDRLQAFYRRYYQPDNAVLLVAGRFDEAQALQLINQNFAGIPKPTRVLPQIYTQEPTQDGERAVTLRRTGDVQVVAAGYHIPGGAHPDSAAASVWLQILSDTPAGRLHKALVETKKASQVFGFPVIFAEPSLSIAGAAVRKEDALDPARDTLLQVLEDAAKSPVTKEEVERARAQLLKQIELNLNSSEQVGVELSEWIGMGDWRLLFINRDRLRKLTPEDVQRVAVNYWKQSNRTLGQFIPTAKPDRAEIPAAPDVQALVKDYKGDAAIAVGEAFDPSPANIESRTTRSATANGLKLVLLPKKTRGNAVVAQLTLRFGDEKSLMNKATAAQLAGAMLMRGTTKHTRQQIQDELDRLKARGGVSGEANTVTASIETTCPPYSSS
jgi:zinc protease